MVMAKKKPDKPKPSAKRVSAWPKKLKALRDRHKLTQAAAAEKAGVSLRTWISWENAQRIPSGPTARLLTMVFPDLA